MYFKLCQDLLLAVVSLKYSYWYGLYFFYKWFVDRNMIVYIAEVECYISNS